MCEVQLYFTDDAVEFYASPLFIRWFGNVSFQLVQRPNPA
jgi:hypothetical protein